MLVIFDTVNTYYLPQFLPIIEVLRRRGHIIQLVCYKNKNEMQKVDQVILDLGIDCTWVSNEQEAVVFYQDAKPDWIIFGNTFSYITALASLTKTAQIGHGVGPKPSYYHKSKTPMTVRFIEGAARLTKIRELYPDHQFEQVGFSKLDPIFNETEIGVELHALGLDVSKKTILYAPTFNPSSLECFPDNWPADFANYNILVKPHAFTYSREQYKKQRRKLQRWAAFENTYIASEREISLLPFMVSADILLSEASSTLFEFSALDKPVIVCDFFKLKWSYRGIFKYRFRNRFGKDNVIYKDIGRHVKSYSELKTVISQQLEKPDEYRKRRTQYTIDHVGPTDGLASLRIVEYLENLGNR